MNAAEFFDLLRRESHGEPVQDEIAQAITDFPGLVALTYATCPLARDDGMRWLKAFHLAGYTKNYLPAQRPEGPMLLYRGCSDARKLGMSWTSDYREACRFAKRNGAGVTQCGNLYTHWAWGPELLAEVDGSGYIHEVMLDVRHLNHQNVKLQQVHGANYMQMCTRYTLAGYKIDFDVMW